MADAQVLRNLAKEVDGLAGAEDAVDARITAALGPMLDRYWTSMSRTVIYEAKVRRRKWIVERTLDGVRINDFPVRHYTGSINAAAELMPAGWRLAGLQQHEADVGGWHATGLRRSPGVNIVSSDAATEALARTACALRAIASDIDAKEADRHA